MSVRTSIIITTYHGFGKHDEIKNIAYDECHNYDYEEHQFTM